MYIFTTNPENTEHKLLCSLRCITLRNAFCTSLVIPVWENYANAYKPEPELNYTSGTIKTGESHSCKIFAQTQNCTSRTQYVPTRVCGWLTRRSVISTSRPTPDEFSFFPTGFANRNTVSFSYWRSRLPLFQYRITVRLFVFHAVYLFGYES